MISKDSVQSSKNNPIFLARFLYEWLKEQGTPVVVSNADHKLYIYNGKFYQEVIESKDKSDFDKILYKFIVEFAIESIWKSARLSELKRALMSSPDCKQVDMDSDTNIMCLNNGLLNVEKIEFFTHSPYHYISTYINIDYEKSALPATKFINFLNSCFTDQYGNIDTDSVQALIDIGGYLLYPRNVIEKMFMFLGEGANGKSLLMYVYEMFFDPKVVTHISLENISKEEGFLREKLPTSRLNIATEAKDKGVDVEEIKKIISGEGITVYRKYGFPIDVFCKSKLFIASNTKPYFNDNTNGIYRRLFIIEFKNKFVDQDEYDDYKNAKRHRVFVGGHKPDMLRAFEEEKNAIFFLFLASLKKLKANKFKIFETKNAKDIKKEYKEANDSFGSWMIDNYEIDYNEFPIPITATDILKEYRIWYAENVSERSLNMSIKTIGGRIKDIYRIEYDRVHKDGKQLTGYALKKKIYGSDILAAGVDTALVQGEVPPQPSIWD
jgi:putative DNA primase/helicase